MIMTRATRSLPSAFAVTLIILSTICYKQAISISDQQQQQVVGESQQQQKQLQTSQSQSTQPLAQLQTQPNATTRTSIPQMVSNAKSSTITHQTPAEQPGALVTNGSRNSKSQQTVGVKHNNSAGRVRQKLTRQNGSDSRTTTSTTLSSTLDQMQEESARLALSYTNTPPLFITPTRDFYVDVSRHLPGYKLTTIQATDLEGDQIKYSLQPAKVRDASRYFSINATSGELRLTNRRILADPKIFEKSDSGNGETTTVATAEERVQPEDRFDDPGASNLYSLNVAASDGQYTSVVEFHIHVSNLTHFGTNSPVRLTPEGGHRAAESMMRAKASEFLTSLYSSSTNQRRTGLVNNSTIVLPSFVNPPLMSDVSQERTNEELFTPSPLNQTSLIDESLQTSIDGEDDDESSTYGLQNPNTGHTDIEGRYGSGDVQSTSRHLSLPTMAAAHNKKQDSVLVVQQPVMFSFIMIIFACLIIAFVLLVFIVPISVRRLKKRLKNMEMQHEQLSKKASNGSSTLTSSCLSSHGGSSTVNSMTTDGSSRDGCHGLPSSLSQFTLASSDHHACAIMPSMAQHQNSLNHHHVSSFARRTPLGRQSSLDSALTNNANENYNSSQLLATDDQQRMMAAQRQLAMMMMINSSGAQDIHSRQQRSRSDSSQITSLMNQHEHQSTNNGLNRINNGAIVNPVYLHQLGVSNTSGDSAINTDNIYCPIDDEFYSTITTESTTVDEDIAAHNYNLYTMQRTGNGRQVHQSNGMTHMLDHNQVGSLVAQTSGNSGNYIGLNCAQPASFLRDTGSPAQSTSSRSSTRSLARFLSLPARHLAHQQEGRIDAKQGDANKRKGGLLDDLNFDFNGSSPTTRICPTEVISSMEHQLAKTIARADRIGQEQQVRHKRHRTQDQSNQSTQDRWEIERHKLKFLDILDEGQFGLVWRCKLRIDSSGDVKNVVNQPVKELTVAVKTLKSFAAKDAKERDELLAEIEIMKLVCNHPNVVRILHCCTRDICPTRPILLVMEHVELGKLQSFLEKSRTNHRYATSASLYNHASSRSLQFTGNGMAVGQDYRTMSGSIASSCSIFNGDYGEGDNDKQQQMPPTRPTLLDQYNDSLTSRDLIKFIYHVAKGMEHISSNCIVHRDLASRNILISSQRVCKIGDFGMARHMENTGDVYERHSRNTKVPVRWMAPEVLIENSFTTKSDVFSFGILMWEIVTLGSTPYRHLKTDQIIQAVARNGERPERPEYCHELLYNIMSSCWSDDPNERPSFQDLVEKLDGLLMSTEEYIQLDQYPDHNYYNISQTAAPFELL